MATTTIDAVLPALKAVIADAGFAETPDPFDFEHAPVTNRDLVYRVTARLTGRDGYLGPVAAERWDIDVYLARRRHGSATDTYLTLLTDVSDLSVSLGATDSDDYTVSTDDQDADVPPPPDEQEYVVGRLRVGVEFDRALS